MKKAIDKLRKWIIRRLGGYTQSVTLRQEYPVRKEVDITKSIAWQEWVAINIARALLRGHLIKFEVEPNERYDTVYASLTVVTEPG